MGEYSLSVTAVGADVQPGDNVYYHTGATPSTAINNTATGGILMGTAMGHVVTGVTAVIGVRLTGVPG